jgi:hypothetical protein
LGGNPYLDFRDFASRKVFAYCGTTLLNPAIAVNTIFQLVV